jgi:CRISPR-associated protein Cmr1
MPTLPPYAPFAKGREHDIVLELQVVTPLYGGGARARKVDRDLPVRASGIRGQLRYWWRCLYAHRFTGNAALYAEEKSLWGGIAKEHRDIVASPVQVYVRKADAIGPGNTTLVSNVAPDPGHDKDAYALWTVNGGDGKPNAERRAPGQTFTLVVRPPRDEAHRKMVEHTIRAWILFGGLGGRTRRGLGSLALTKPEQRALWLPAAMTETALRDVLDLGPGGECGPIARLRGSHFKLGATVSAAQALDAWHTAIGWLRDFRQGASPTPEQKVPGDFARMRPDKTNRMGRSRWPEADKLRTHTGQFDHTVLPGHESPSMHWPRAGFGLPLQFRFQSEGRNGGEYSPRPPGANGGRTSKGKLRMEIFQLGWTIDGGDRVLSRLASRLIVKPVQLRDGRFAPLALWLDRNLPRAKVGLYLGNGNARTFVPDTVVSFALTPPEGDKHLFGPLDGKANLRDAFMTWLAHPPRGAKGGVL